MKRNIVTVVLFITALSACENKSLTTQEDIIPISKDNTIYQEVDQMPEYVNGMTDFYGYIQKNLKYPEQAKQLDVEGKVYIEFVVSKTGTIESAKVLRGIGSGCDEAALEVFQNSPNWKPGIKNGEAVNVKMVLPLTFKLRKLKVHQR